MQNILNKLLHMKNMADDLSERFINLIINIIKLEKHLCKNYSGRHIYGQLFRSGTSTGANYEEARAGESRADFIHKMQIVLKELRESNFWIKLITKAKLVSAEDDLLEYILNESFELTNIIAKSIITAKSKNDSHNK
jgi:four helix bundle protein